MRPPYGICLPVKLHRVRDGDTIEVTLPGSERILPIRLLGCWAPELSTPEGKKAKAAVEKLMQRDPPLSVFIPAPADPLRLLSVLTFDRVLGHIFIDDETTLSEWLVEHEHATRTKTK